jgi:hypothetical protein
LAFRIAHAFRRDCQTEYHCRDIHVGVPEEQSFALLALNLGIGRDVDDNDGARRPFTDATQVSIAR